MKRKSTFLTAALVLLAFLTIPMGMRGQTRQSVTIPMNQQGWSDAQVIGSGTLKDNSGANTSFEYTSDKGEASNAPTYYNSGTNVRFYCKKNGTGDGGSMTITPIANSGITITSVELTASSGYTPTTKYNVDGGSDESLTWSGTTGTVSNLTATTSFKFRNANAANNTNQLRITQIVINYTVDGANPTVDNPTINPNGGIFMDSQEVSISCATDGATIYYTTNGNDPTTSSSVYSAPFTITATTTVKAFAVKSGYDNSAIATATFTKSTPMTVAEARTFIDGLNGGTSDDVFVMGTISQIDQYYSDYHSITYWISDDGTTTDQLEVYSGKGLDGADFNSIDDLVLQSEVIVKGKLKKYNEIYEFTQTSQIVSLTLPAIVIETPTFSPVGGTYTEPQTVTISCATPEVDIYYTTDGSDPDDESESYTGPFTVSETTTIKAIAYDGNDNASAVATVTYTIAPMLTFNKTVGHNPVEGQIYMIVDLHSGRALTSANGSSSVPAAVEVTISDNQITTDDTDLQWTFEAVEGGYIVRSVADNTKWLYSTNANNGVRVGTNEDNVWTLDITDETNSDYHGFKHNTTERYLGVYSNQDWRAYTTIHANIKDTQIALFVNGEVPVVPSITIENNNEIAYNATSGSFNFTVDNPVEGGVTTVSEDVDWISDAAISGNSVIFTTTVNNNGVSRQGVITLTYTYNRATVTKNVTVTQEAGPVVFTTIPALFEAATSTESDILVSFDNWVVSGVSTNGKNVFVTDNDGNGFVIFNNEGGLDQTYSVGNILSGTAISCSLKKYNGFAELLNVDASDLTITAGGTVTEANIAMADLSGVNTGALVHYDNLICSVNNNKYYLSDGTTTIQVYNSLYAFEALENGETYNITGVYQQFNSTKEILPRSEADIVKVQVQHEQYTLTVSNLVHVNTNVFDAANQDEMLLEGEGSVQFYDGTLVLISVDVEEGYLLESLIVDDANVISQIDGTGAYTFTMPTHNVTVTATAVEQIVPSDADYVRITSLDQLTDGSIVVIASRYNTDATNYYAMKNTVSGGKAQGEAFVSTTSNGNEILPATIVNDVNNYYWVVSVNDGAYTFTNANGDVISYNTSTNFNMNGANTTWSIVRGTSGDALVSSYEGFKITNVNTNTRCIAFRGDTEVFGPYSTQNLTDDNYNFFLDFFVQTEASETVTQTIELVAGWNWFSTYIAGDPFALLQALEESLGDKGVLIKSKEFATDYLGEEDGWDGDLEEVGLTNEKTYMIKTSAACTVTLEGTPVNPATVGIQIKKGWNWIGFPFAEEVSVAVAFADFPGEEGDILKTFGASTDYYGPEDGWDGDLETMEPGKGYMYYSVSDTPKTLVFSAGTGSKAPRAIDLPKVMPQKQVAKKQVAKKQVVDGNIK